MKNTWIVGLAALALSVVTVVSASARTVRLQAELIGANEVPPISTTATGTFSARIFDDGNINFTLTFDGLAANATVAHIHFGQKNVAGGVMIFLCGGGNQPACPASTSGTIQGTITADNVVALTAQGIGAGELAEALRAIAIGEGYANVHNATFPAGEIRGQVTVKGHLDGDKDED